MRLEYSIPVRANMSPSDLKKMEDWAILQFSPDLIKIGIVTCWPAFSAVSKLSALKLGERILIVTLETSENHNHNVLEVLKIVSSDNLNIQIL